MKFHCDHDCFHCGYPDCQAHDPMTREESKILTGVHGGWEKEIRRKFVKELLSRGFLGREIATLLGISMTDVRTIEVYLCKEKSRSRLASESGANKTISTAL